MNVNDAFPCKYLKASDLSKPFKLRIRLVTKEKMAVTNDERLVLYFQGATKGMVLNKTNALTVANLLGPETDGWINGIVEVYPTTTEYQGAITPCLRIRQPQPPSSGSPPVVPGPTTPAASKPPTTIAANPGEEIECLDTDPSF